MARRRFDAFSAPRQTSDTLSLPKFLIFNVELRGTPDATVGDAMLSPIVDQVERYMTLLTARQQLTASNIANADTPGYKTRDIDFREELAAASGVPHVREAGGLAVRNDGNNVSLDREARNLAENSLRFQIASQFIQNQIRMTRTALQEGRS
jgi:flagellar basal-body rod protein FlgB